jgi:hypothetical protein
MTAVRLVRVDGRVLHVDGLDLVDGTPVLDIKPYIPYADAFVDSSAGWVEGKDERRAWDVAFAPLAELQLAWVESETGLDLRARITAALGLGPQPHAYRRIKETSDGGRVLAVKEWRARFGVDVEAQRMIVERIDTGYRPRDLERGDLPAHAVHRAYVERFGRV